MGFLTGKRFLIVGLLSDRSIAYGIAQAMHREGAELAFTYQTEKFADRVRQMAKEWNAKIVLPCDVSNDTQIQAVFSTLANEWGTFDGFIHSVAFAPADQLEGDFIDSITREGFAIAHDISSYSLAALAKASFPLLNKGSSITALTYLGAERTVPNYNVMGLAKASLEANIRYLANSLGPRGVRVNGISAGPIRTLAASGIKNFRKMLATQEKISPLRCNVSIEDVGNTAAFLSSNLASGITGEIIHVDAGFHITGITDTPAEN